MPVIPRAESDIIRVVTSSRAGSTSSAPVLPVAAACRWSVPRMKPRLMQSFGVTDRGTVRPINEDQFVADEELGLLVVADGMGGHQAGEVASQAAVEAIVTFIRRTADDGECTWPFGIDPTLTFDGNRLRTAIAIANRRVFRLSESQDEFTGMGTTIASALLAEGRAIVGHAGDSRVYHWSGGRLVRLTADDTWAASLLATRTADAESVKHHPMRNVLTNVVGVREDATVHLQEYLARARRRAAAQLRWHARHAG